MAERRKGTPGWVKAFALSGAVLLAVVIVMHLTGHAPMHHLRMP